MIQRTKKPRRAALRNSFHSVQCAPGGTRAPTRTGRAAGGGGLQARALVQGRASSCLQTRGEGGGGVPARWKGCLQAEVLRGPVSPGVLAENTGAASSTPWEQEVNRIFCVGVRTGSLLLPAPHSTGWAQVPKPPGLWRVPWAKPLREKGSGGGGFKLKSVPGFPARAIPNQDLDSSSYPNTQRSPSYKLQLLRPLLWELGRFPLLTRCCWAQMLQMLHAG